VSAPFLRALVGLSPPSLLGRLEPTRLSNQAKLVLASPETPLLSLTKEPLISCPADAGEKEFTELFDKYNLLTPPVIDERSKIETSQPATVARLKT
jgi:hypothetical protein